MSSCRLQYIRGWFSLSPLSWVFLNFNSLVIVIGQIPSSTLLNVGIMLINVYKVMSINILLLIYNKDLYTYL